MEMHSNNEPESKKETFRSPNGRRRITTTNKSKSRSRSKSQKRKLLKEKEEIVRSREQNEKIRNEEELKR